jgi:energy-converting hydrogenase Eha subunit H
MLLVAEAKTAGEAGVAPFVFTKAKNFLKNYSVPELQTLSSKLVRMYHDAHRGIHDFEIALERFVLHL